MSRQRDPFAQCKFVHDGKVCQATIRSSNMGRHLKKCHQTSGLKYPAVRCELVDDGKVCQALITPKYMARHIKLCHSSLNAKFPCYFCKKKIQLDKFQSHFKKSHYEQQCADNPTYQDRNILAEEVFYAKLRAQDEFQRNIKRIKLLQQPHKIYYGEQLLQQYAAQIEQLQSRQEELPSIIKGYGKILKIINKLIDKDFPDFQYNKIVRQREAFEMKKKKTPAQIKEQQEKAELRDWDQWK